MSVITAFFYYCLTILLAFFSAIQYCRGETAKACFFLIGMATLLILNEVKRNARIMNYYNDCSFITPPVESHPPHPGPAEPGSLRPGDNAARSER